jgi:phospholipid-binding lipoprotein MlaA
MSFKKLIFLAIISTFASACAPIKNDYTYDPYENTNRTFFEFNMMLQENIVDPVADVYVNNTPDILRYFITNFFKNLEEPLTFVNNILQFEFVDAGKTIARFAINSTLGFGGAFEVADQIGLERHRETFNQTFALWGISDGPYLVPPFTRPMNTRELVSFGFNFLLDPVIWIKPYSEFSLLEKGAVFGADVFNSYSRSYTVINSMKAQSLDFYETAKSSYQQMNYFDIKDLYKDSADTSSFDTDMDEEEEELDELRNE